MGAFLRSPPCGNPHWISCQKGVPGMTTLRPMAALLLLQGCRAYYPAAGGVAVRRTVDLAAPRLAAPRAVVDDKVDFGSKENTGTKLGGPPAVAARRTEGKLYTSRESPKVAGGVKVGARRVVVITGASSGLGLAATIALLDGARHVCLRTLTLTLAVNMTLVPTVALALALALP